MHHATKASLVKKYSELNLAGATEEQLREGLKAEEKVEHDADIEDIISSLEVAPDPNAHPPVKGTFTVAKGMSFRDINDFSKEWKEGDDVSGLDATRLSGLVEAGLVEKSK
jgi:hypothetical protein